MSTDPLTAFMQATAITQPAFPPGSRYHGLPVFQLPASGSRPAIPYVGRRFLPDPADLPDTGAHRVSVGDRLDNLAEEYKDAPEMWWQIADANPVIRPADLTATPGRVLRRG